MFLVKNNGLHCAFLSGRTRVFGAGAVGMPAGGGPDGQRRLPPAFSSGTRWRAGAFRGGRVVSGAEMKSSRAGTLTARSRVLSPQVHGPAGRPPAPVAVRGRSGPSEARTQRAEVGRRPRASGSGTCARPRGRSSPEGEAGSLARALDSLSSAEMGSKPSPRVRGHENDCVCGEGHVFIGVL